MTDCTVRFQRVNLAIYWCPTYIPWQEYSNGNNDQIYFQCTQRQLVQFSTNLRIFALDEFVVSNILTIPRIYGAKDYSVDEDISGLALRGKTLETDTMASGLLRLYNVSCTPLFQALQKILTHTSESSNPSLSCFTILWGFVKSHRLSINNFVTIAMGNWHTVIYNLLHEELFPLPPYWKLYLPQTRFRATCYHFPFRFKYPGKGLFFMPYLQIHLPLSELKFQTPSLWQYTLRIP